ncbi:MAG TPA: hypothetical protein VMN04_07770 [Thermoanaerobaculia bacterium]|nr:hypothetical protein [Thermoanaerobaculia bacterium]
MKRLAVLVVAAAAGGAAAQVNPGGQLTETKDGIVFQRNTPTPWPTPSRPERSTDTGGLVKIAPSHGPAGPAVVNAAFVTFRGRLVRIEKGAAITILDGRTGKERRVLLAKATVVAEGIKEGDAVAVRVPLEEGSGARTADRVELQKTPAATEHKSKFAQAQAPATR